MADDNKTRTATVNPFGAQTVSRRPAREILMDNFAIFVGEYDRGNKVWDDNRRDPDTGKVDPGLVHVPSITVEPLVMFKTNEERGSGNQTIPLTEFLDYVEVLEGIIASDYAVNQTEDPTQYIPTPVVAKESFKMVFPRKDVIGQNGKTRTVADESAGRTVVSVRTASGRGKKPIQVARDEFPGVVACLRQVADHLDAYEIEAWREHASLNPNDTLPEHARRLLGRDDEEEVVEDENVLTGAPSEEFEPANLGNETTEDDEDILPEDDESEEYDESDDDGDEGEDWDL